MAALLKWIGGLFGSRDYTSYRRNVRKTKYAVKGRKKRNKR